MTDEKMSIPERSRFNNVANKDDIKAETWPTDMERYGCSSKELAIAVGAKDLGYCLVSLDPGKRSCPYHFHHSEEEVFYVLEGEGTLRQGDTDGEEEIPLRAGDVISFPAGTGIAHQFLNTSDKPFVYFALSNRIKSDVAEYPDSNKVLIRGRRMMLRRTPTLKYFDGEI